MRFAKANLYLISSALTRFLVVYLPSSSFRIRAKDAMRRARIPMVFFVLFAISGSSVKSCDEDIVLDPSQKNSGSSSSQSSSSSFASSSASSSAPAFSSASSISSSPSASSSVAEIATSPNVFTTDASPLLSVSQGDKGQTSGEQIPLDSTTDSDKDGVSDSEELDLGLDPKHPDSDNDGFADGFELAEGFDPKDSGSHPSSVFGSNDPAFLRKSPGLADSDGDGLPDTYEEQIGTNPTSPDTDSDGVADGAELLEQSDPLRPSKKPRIDRDGDGLSDAAEIRLGSDPTKRDSDLDSLPDPMEFLFSTDPTHPDSDLNGILDGWESGGRNYRYAPGGIRFR